MKEEVYREMEVKGLTLDPLSSMPIILLKEVAGRQTIPIWIGILEASAIAAELEKITLSRPMTHDLLNNIIYTLGAQVIRIEVNDIKDNTFYATVFLKKGRGKKEIAVDARPSDAIALALRSDSPIFVSKKVIERSRRIDLSGKAGAEKGNWEGVLEKLSPEHFGKYKM
ncbi:MAG: bifunctional nuclease family protein [Deltaproteobacteria bacterium]|nr:bifunctional nuclease family protein [Deltaproteobacteria bacterium]